MRRGSSGMSPLKAKGYLENKCYNVQTLTEYLLSKYSWSILYDFVEGSGNPVDKSGNSANGVAVGGSYVPVPSGFGFSLNGTSDNITVSSYPANGTYSIVIIASADFADFGSVNRSLFQTSTGSTKGLYIDAAYRPYLILGAGNSRKWEEIKRFLDGQPHVYELYIPGPDQADIESATLTIDGITIAPNATVATGAQDAFTCLRIGRTEYAWWKGVISLFGVSTSVITEDFSLLTISDRAYNYIEKVSATEYNIFVRPSGSRWFIYRFVHTVDAGINEDNWRLYTINACDFTPSYDPHGVKSDVSDKIWIGGSQVDHAMYMYGTKPGWVSGIHGEELVQDITFYVDGVAKTLGIGEMLRGKDITIVQHTHILDQDDLSTLATAETIFKWLSDDLYMTDRIVFQKSKEISNWYWPMSPYTRGATVTTKGQLLGGDIQDISSAGFTVVHSGVASAKVWNDTNAFEMTVTVLNPSVALNNFAWAPDLLTFITNDDAYNKLYFTLIGDTKRLVPSGTDLTCESQFSPRWPVTG